MRRPLSLLYLACGWLAGISLIGICILMLLLSLGRIIGFNLRGGDEITAWASTATFALGLAHTFYHGEMVRVGLLIEGLSSRWRLVAESLCLIIGCVFTGLLAFYCIDFVWDGYRFHEPTPGVLVIPLWIPQAPLAFGTSVLFIAMVEQLILCLTGRRPTYAKDAPKTTEEVLERAASSV